MCELVGWVLVGGGMWPLLEGGGGGGWYFVDLWGEWHGGLKWSMEVRDGDIDRWSR